MANKALKIVSSGRALHSSEFHQKKQKKRRTRIWAVLVLLLVLLCLVLVVLRLDRFQIDSVEIKGASIAGQEELKKAVVQKLEGNYFWLIPKTNFLLFPRGNIEKTIPVDMPRVKSLVANLEGRNKLVIEAVERQPAYLFCGMEAEDVLSNCYFLDNEGFVFAEAPAFSGDVYFIFSKEVADKNSLGKYLVEPSEFSGLTNFLQELLNLSLEVKRLDIRRDEESNLTKYHAYLLKSGRITWNAGDNFNVIFSNLEAFLLSDVVKSDKSFLSKISYIDLSIPNKVFYKFK